MHRRGGILRPDERRTQNIVGFDGLLPGLAEALGVELLDVDAQLIGVGRAVRLVAAVEQNALLHRRQRVQIDDVTRRHRQCRQLRLGQVGEVEIRGCHATGRAVAAMFDQALQFAAIGLGQRLDGLGAVHAAAEGPGQFQLTAENLSVDAQPIAQRRVPILIGAGAVSAWHKQRALLSAERTVELTEVIEGHPWLRQRLQLGSTREVTQHAITDAFARHGAQLLLDRAQRRSGIGLRSQAHREQAAEPADRAAQVDVVEQVFTTMAFELD